MAFDLTLLIPGLFGIKAQGLYQGLSLTAIERILSRAKRVDDNYSAGCLEAMLCRATTGATDAGGGCPVAAISRRWEELSEPREVGSTDGEFADNWYIRSDPVYARAGLGELTLIHSRELAITAKEANTIVASINDHFSNESWRIESPNPYRWYIQCVDAPGIRTTPLSQVTGPVTEEYLPVGEQAAYWRAVLNEIQMLLHSHPVNLQRETDESLPINSVWMWGEGRQSHVDKNRWDMLCSDNHIGRAIARSAGAMHVDACDGLSTVLHLEPRFSQCLVVIDWLDLPSRRVDLESWRKEMGRLDGLWFQPLLDALRSGIIASLEISLGDGVAFRIKHSQIRHWWRRHLSFSEISHL